MALPVLSYHTPSASTTDLFNVNLYYLTNRKRVAYTEAEY